MSPRVFVPGVPVAQGSKRYLGRGQRGKLRMAHDNAERLEPWRVTIAAKAEEKMAGGEPTRAGVALALRFIFVRPKSHYGSGRNAELLKPSAPRVPTGKPDIDKLERAVLDALTAIVYVDDSQVVTVNKGKEYGNAAGLDLRWDVIA